MSPGSQFEPHVESPLTTGLSWARTFRACWVRSASTVYRYDVEHRH